MDGFKELVRQRYSCRRYSSKPVPQELIDQCLDTARMAPSACSAQPWKFWVVNDQISVQRMFEAMQRGFYGKGMNKFVQTAPVVIAVETLKGEKMAPWLAGLMRDVRYEMMDAAIASDHLTLQATELGLATCWIGWFNEKEVKKVLGLERGSHVDVMLTLGYAEDSAPSKKRKSLDQIRSYVQLK